MEGVLSCHNDSSHSVAPVIIFITVAKIVPSSLWDCMAAYGIKGLTKGGRVLPSWGCKVKHFNVAKARIWWEPHKTCSFCISCVMAVPLQTYSKLNISEPCWHMRVCMLVLNCATLQKVVVSRFFIRNGSWPTLPGSYMGGWEVL